MNKFNHYYQLAQSMLNDKEIKIMAISVEIEKTDELIAEFEKRFGTHDEINMRSELKKFTIKLI